MLNTPRPPIAEKVVELALLDVYDERIRQNVKFTGTISGIQRHNILTWIAILGEEFGESSQAALDLTFMKDPSPTAFQKAVEHLRTELVQTAAVAFAIIERIDDQADSSIYETEGNYTE